MSKPPTYYFEFSKIGFVGLDVACDKDAPTLRRLIWGVFVFGGFSFMIFHICGRILTFQSGVTVSSSFVIPMRRLPMAQVTICLETETYENFLNRHPDVNFTYAPRAMLPKPYDIFESIDIKTLPDIDIFNFIEAAYVIKNRLCYMINRKGTLKIVGPGRWQGLKIALRNPYSDYLQSGDLKGFTVHIGVPSEKPSFVHHYINIPLGWSVDIGLSYEVTKFLHGTGHCSNNVLRGEFAYSQNGCQVEKYQKMLMVEICKCMVPAFAFTETEPIPTDLPGVRTVRICDNITELNNCEHELNLQSIDGHLRDPDYYLKRFGCPVHCEQEEYKTTITGMPMAGNNTNIAIYFKSLTTTVHNEVLAYTWLALLADLGGATGLFLGASLLTLGQLFEYGLHKVWHFFTKELKHTYLGKKTSNIKNTNVSNK